MFPLKPFTLALLCFIATLALGEVDSKPRGHTMGKRDDNLPARVPYVALDPLRPGGGHTDIGPDAARGTDHLYAQGPLHRRRLLLRRHTKSLHISDASAESGISSLELTLPTALSTI
jgi:hypothetical protein